LSEIPSRTLPKYEYDCVKRASWPSAPSITCQGKTMRAKPVGRISKVPVAVIGNGRKNAEQHAHDRYGIGRDMQPGEDWHESARQWMDEVEVGISSIPSFA